jgi:hypothetical protein
MENIEVTQKSVLLDMLMDSMPKAPEVQPLSAEAQANRAPAPEPVKTESQGETVDLLA